MYTSLYLLTNKMKPISKELYIIRKKIVHTSLLFSVVFSLIDILNSTIRVIILGFQPIFIIELTIPITLTFLYVFRNSIHFTKIVYTLIALLLIGAINGFVVFGIFSPSKTLLVLIPIFSYFTSSKKETIFSFSISIVLYVIFAYLYSSKKLIINHDLKHLDHEVITWALDGTLLLFSSLIIVISANIYVKQLTIKMDALESKNSELEQSNTELNEFIHITSHDLQEPLRNISMFTEILKTRLPEESQDDIEKQIEAVTNTAQRMSQNIHNILEYLRVGQDFELHHNDIEEILQEVKNDIRSLITEHDTQIDFQQQTKSTIVANSVGLRIIFQNLISYAIRQSTQREKQRITIDLEDEKGLWKICFRYKGRIIPQHQWRDIFHPFGLNESSEYMDESRISLSQCQKIVERHGGDIWIDCSEENGTCICFTLPQGL